MSDAMRLKPAAAIFILVIMILSVAGFALNSGSFQQAQQQAPEIPTVIREPLSTQDQVLILRSGRVLIEHFYNDSCLDCLDKNAKLEEFASRLEGYVVVNEVQGNETRLGAIGANGRIVSLVGNSLEYGDLLDVFCDIAITQPRACILREF